MIITILHVKKVVGIVELGDSQNWVSGLSGMKSLP